MDFIIDASIKYASGQRGAQFGSWLRRELPRRGAPYIKLGQFIRTRPDVVGADIANSLCNLCEHMIEPPFQEPCKIVSRNFIVDPVPFAGASIASVHRGIRIDDGLDVAVKIKKKECDESIHTFVKNVRFLANMCRYARVRRDIVDWLLEYTTWIEMEIDFSREAEYMTYMRRMKTVIVPEPLLVTSNTLVMTHINSKSPIDPSITHKNDIANQIFTSFIEQVVVFGMYHADLHPGNVGVCDNGSIVIFDFASVRRFPPEVVDYLPELVFATIECDARTMAELLLKMGFFEGSIDDVECMCREIRRYLVSEIQLDKVVHGLRQNAKDIMPTQIMASFIRAFGIMEGTCRLIDPNFCSMDAILVSIPIVAQHPQFHRREFTRFLNFIISTI
jgi:predicted unusual protein kinase regulating ubiquinone biosynthesis (AarF/ABC1/UbiB family)